MTVRTLSDLDRDICQPLGRILQEAFADGFIGTGSISMNKTVAATEAGSFSDGVYKFKMLLDRPATSTVVGTTMLLNFKDSATIQIAGGGRYYNAVLGIDIDTIGAGTPNLSGGYLAGIAFRYLLDETDGKPLRNYPLFFHAGTYNWDGLFDALNDGDLGDSAIPEEAGKTMGWDGDLPIKKIPVQIGNTIYYLLAGTTIEGATSA